MDAELILAEYEARRHAGFRENMLTRLQGGDRHGGVQIGPRTDDDGVNVFVRDDIFPPVVCARNVKLRGRPQRRFLAAIANRHDLYAFAGQQTGYVAQAGVGTQADDADADGRTGRDAGRHCDLNSCQKDAMEVCPRQPSRLDYLFSRKACRRRV